MNTFWLLLLLPAAAWAQEADAGFEVHGTLTALGVYGHDLTEAPRSGTPIVGGFRTLLYPTLKLNRDWSFTATVEGQSRPYSYDDFRSQGYGIRVQLLRAHVTYSRVRKNRSFIFRAGELSTAFGSFPLRYDDAVNPLINAPPTYGYYGKGVTLNGVFGAQVDGTWGPLDARVQFANSSPANPRSIFDHDQYGNVTAGFGWTIFQGLRVGVSAYRGPYLDRKSPFYFPGEAPPRSLPATALGFDIQWAHGPWNSYGEYQRFQFDYRAIPVFRFDSSYGEIRRVLHPRWYVAARASYLRYAGGSTTGTYETAVGYRPNRYQLLKIGYDIEQTGSGSLSSRAFTVALVSTFRPISIPARLF